MSNIEVPLRINQIISLFHFICFWRGDSVSNFNSTISKIVHLIVYVYYPVSLMAGAFTNNDNETEQMFLVVLSIVTFVMAIRLYYILWKKDEIIGFIHNLGTHAIADDELFHRNNNKITIFIKLVSFMELMLMFAVIAMTIIMSPIVSNDKMLPMNIYIPLDWRHNELFYWIAFTLFVIYEMMISMSSSLLNPIIWYLMMSCAIKYEVLGNELKNLFNCDDGASTSVTSDEDDGDDGASSVTSVETKDAFQMKLILLIKNHRDLQEFERFSTSADNPFQLGVYAVVMLYSFFDIFMVTHFGTQIKFISSRLSYSLFESDWFDQSQPCKKSIIILMEVLKRPQELVIGKVYPLDVVVFTQILKLAYSMFNILQNL